MTHKYTILNAKTLSELTARKGTPCLSLYQETHRRHSGFEQNPIRYRHLVKELQTSLRQKYSDAETRMHLEPFEGLAFDRDFWDHSLNGLAVLGSPGFFQVFQFQRPTADLAIVANSFHTKPLRHFLQSASRYHVLGLSLDKIRLFEGDRSWLDELELAPGVPRTIDEALGAELTEAHHVATSKGGVGGSNTSVYHSYGSKKDDAKIDMERFCRVIDGAILEHYSHPSGLPVILAALPEHHHLFHKISHNPHLLAGGITANPDGMTMDDLRQRAWEIVEPQYTARLDKLVEEFAVAKSKGHGSDDVAAVAHAAAAGRVDTLLIQADCQVAGRLDSVTGKIKFADITDPQVDDLLDDLGELVGRKGGRVLVVPSAQMPGESGLAATYRY